MEMHFERKHFLNFLKETKAKADIKQTSLPPIPPTTKRAGQNCIPRLVAATKASMEVDSPSPT